MGQHKVGWAVHRSLAILVAVLLFHSPAKGMFDDTQECSSCSIYILDLSSFAHTHGYPVCDLNKLVVDRTTGVVYLKERDTGIEDKVGHQFGTHSAPWYLMKVILPQPLLQCAALNSNARRIGLGGARVLI